MIKEVKQKWLEALRSGEYEQSSNVLRSEGGFCCLGVLCDISRKGKWEYRSLYNLEYSCEGTKAMGFLTSPIEKWAGINIDEQKTLARLNDDENYSFKEIADYIEENL